MEDTLDTNYIGDRLIEWVGNFACPAGLEHDICVMLEKKKIKLYRLEIEPLFHSNRTADLFFSNGIIVKALDLDKYMIFSFRLMPMIGCCGILVSTGTVVGEKYRGNKLSYLMQNVKEDLAMINGYGIMYATTVSSNEAENHVLEKRNWIKTNSFTNPRTGNQVFQWTKYLNYPVIEEEA